MKKVNALLYLGSAVILAAIIALCSFTPISATDGSSSGEVYKDKLYFTMKNGELVRPTGYRSWVFVGTPVTPHDLNGGRASFPEMHNVYIDPGSYNHYKETGDFREGTIIVKELVSVGATSASSGKGYFEGEFLGLEASVKSKQHFPNEPDYWAIFSFTNPESGILKATAPALPVANCVACHQANAAHDNVFTQYYPVLRAARGVGKGIVPENSAKRTTEK